MIYITRTGFFNVIISQYHDFFMLDLNFALRLILDHYLHLYEILTLYESEQAVSAGFEVQASRRSCTD